MCGTFSILLILCDHLDKKINFLFHVVTIIESYSKGKMYKSIVRPATLYGMETVAVTERQLRKMEVPELKMVRWALIVTRKKKIKNE